MCVHELSYGLLINAITHPRFSVESTNTARKNQVLLQIKQTYLCVCLTVINGTETPRTDRWRLRTTRIMTPSVRSHQEPRFLFRSLQSKTHFIHVQIWNIISPSGRNYNTYSGIKLMLTTEGTSGTFSMVWFYHSNYM